MLANIVSLPMQALPPKRWRVYRLVGDSGTEYRLSVYKSCGDIFWELKYKTAQGLPITVNFDKWLHPRSIKVNGFTWRWSSHREKWETDAEGLSNGIQDSIANNVNAALKEVHAQTAALARDIERKHREERLRAIKEDERRRDEVASRNREHFQEVLQKV